ncbi:MAG: glutamate racemase, partial [Ignavibacteria bacterium]|nr:glutamate racemase [Ignavibacteria bacterium]
MFTSIQQKPIGIFDSGIGGLTVVKEIINLLPNENLIYFGDTARVPYGNKSNETIKHYSIQNTKFLLHHNVKMIVVACNSASSIALDVVSNYTDIPVIGVIKPGALSAVANTKNKRIVVIGTHATISNKAYEKEITNLNGNVQVMGKACPLFVPIVEEGWQNNEIAFLTAKEYLAPLKKFYFDTLILGCTHYPLLKKVIQRVVGEEVTLI